MWKEWDWLSQKEGESVTTYVDKFWATLLEVTPFMTITNEEKMRKFDAGLQPPIRKSLKVYPYSTLLCMMELAIVAEELHVKGQPRNQELNTFHAKQKALQEQSKTEKSAKINKQPPSKNGSNFIKKKGGKT